MLAEEQPVTDAAVQPVVGEAVGRCVGEREARVPSQDVELIRLAIWEVQHQAGARQRDGGRLRAEHVDGVLVTAFQLDPHAVARVVADADAAPDLVLEQEGAVISGVRPEPADLDLLGALREGGAAQQTQ